MAHVSILPQLYLIHFLIGSFEYLLKGILNLCVNYNVEKADLLLMLHYSARQRKKEKTLFLRGQNM